jgi:uncharacterized phage protein (TIGR01671 family)
MKNREIKFRAYFGGIMYYSDSQESAKLLNIPLGKSIIGGFMAAFAFDETLMQFTGLYDKNGKEIYEGDIMVLPGGTNKSVIEYKDGAYHFSFEEFDINPIRQDRTKRWEIIGNIYQHPDLLK